MKEQVSTPVIEAEIYGRGRHSYRKFQFMIGILTYGIFLHVCIAPFEVDVIVP
jgi:hypothetical protein